MSTPDLNEETLIQAFQKGVDAYIADKSFGDDNPYEVDSDNWVQWREGFEETAESLDDRDSLDS